MKYVCWIWAGIINGESAYRVYYGNTLPHELTFIDHTLIAHQLTDKDKVGRANGDAIDIIYGEVFP